MMKSNPDMADSDVTMEYLVDNVWIVGSPDAVTEKLRQLYHDLGALVFCWLWATSGSRKTSG